MTLDLDIGILKTLVPQALVSQFRFAVLDFWEASGLRFDGYERDGFLSTTLATMTEAVYTNTGIDLWVAVVDGILVGYAIARLNKDSDGRMAYIVQQAWIKASHRGKAFVRGIWTKIRNRAKELLAARIVLVSSRNPEAYRRFLGRQLTVCATLLNEDLWR